MQRPAITAHAPCATCGRGVLSHHLAAIVTSAVMYDADHIAHQITALQLANKTKKQQQRRRATA